LSVFIGHIYHVWVDSDALAVALQAEIEKVRKRREERAAERALQEEELSIMQRERAVLEGIEMEAKEEEV